MHRTGDMRTMRSEVSARLTGVSTLRRRVDGQMKIDDARCNLKSVDARMVLAGPTPSSDQIGMASDSRDIRTARLLASV